MNNIWKYAILWLICILFDLHKYGCWISDDATYWYPISYILVPISLLPFFPWLINKWVVWAENNDKQYTYQFVLLWLPGIMATVAFLSEGYIFRPEWYDKGLWGILRTDSSTLAAIGLILITSFSIWLHLREGKNPFKD